jgi:hypothetical protein
MDNLSKYGYSFQVKVIHLLINDNKFAQQSLDIISPEFFDSDSAMWLVKVIVSYYKKFKISPTTDVFKSEYLSIEDEVLKESVKKLFLDIKMNSNPTDSEYVKNEVIRFMRQQKLKTAILQSADILRNSNDTMFDEVRVIVNDALNAGVERDIGHEYIDEIDIRYAEGSRNPIPTNWKEINAITGGGLGSGELGVVVAPAGGAKSWVLVNIATSAMKQGKRVIYYTLELNEFYVARRFDAYFLGVPFTELNAENVKENLQDIYDTMGGDLIVKCYPTKTAGVSSITAHIEKCIAQGKTPDMIIIDYADLLKPMKSGEKRLELNDIYEDIRGLAGTYRVPVWTASQSSRTSTTDDIIEGNKVSESYNKIMIADLVVSIQRKPSDKVVGIGLWHLIKNRFGPDGLTFPAKMNTFTGHMQVYDENSIEGRDVMGSIESSRTNIKKEYSKFIRKS